jgi:adenylate cyclase
MGVGINTGSMVVGNLGSSRRFTYTALGDHVNLGSRLEQLNKVYGTHILVSEHTLAQIGDEFLVRPIDRVRVKGKQTAVQVFELMGPTATSADLEEFAGQFNQALSAYRDRSWEEAFRRFTALASRRHNDGPTRIYVERALAMLSHPPGPGWDGVHLADPLG